jgi:tRNA A37 threonylcarbamoyladenosine synthetase subunit TsaC/SUA5/YrdC
MTHLYYGCMVATDTTGPSLLGHNSNESVDVSKICHYNSFSLNKEIQLHITSPHQVWWRSITAPTRAQHEAHTCMHAASTIGSSHHSPHPPSALVTAHQSTVARAHTPCPTTLVSATCTWVPPTQTASVATRTSCSVYVQNSLVHFGF